MKNFLVLLSILVCTICYAETFNQYWYANDSLYSQTTCTTGGDIILPQSPTKYGYDFIGWEKTYTPIEYLESTGTQYIDTGITASSVVYRVETKFAKVSGAAAILGNQTGDAMFYIAPNGSLAVYMPSGTTNYLLNDTNPHTISLEYYNSNITIGGDYTGTFSTAWNPTIRIELFANNYKGRHEDKGLIKLYFARFWQNDILVRDFIPVLDYNGTPCMYDKVTEQFFYNQGTGDFIAGPIISE